MANHYLLIAHITNLWCQVQSDVIIGIHIGVSGNIRVQGEPHDHWIIFRETEADERVHLTESREHSQVPQRK